MPDLIDTPEILTAITKGGVDDDLNEIAEAIRRRQRYLASERAYGLKNSINAGDIVRISPNAPIRPKYLPGLELVVDKVNRTRVEGHFEGANAIAARRYSNGIVIPIEHLEQVS